MAHEIELQWQQLFSPIHLKEGEDNDLIVCPEVIPIIFVPGIMGSVLQRQDKVVWDPATDFKMLLRYGVHVTPNEKKELLIGSSGHSDTYLSVVGKNHILCPHNGWEGVSESHYGELRQYLERASWSEQINMCFHMPVHAFGYNWTNDPRTNSRELQKYIRKVIKKHNTPSESVYCRQVILLTHSMGGLVARAACVDQETRGRVLGVVHTMQPASGAPAAYWRMKAGFERVVDLGVFKNVATAWVLGSNGEEMTALLGNMPGGLALLPTKQYRDSSGNGQWLYLTHRGQVIDRLPKRINLSDPSKPQFDPYTDIYRRFDVAWGLTDPNLVDPEGDPERGVQWYLGALKQAESFHDWLRDQQHPNTWHIYGRGLDTCESVELTTERLAADIAVTPPQIDELTWDRARVELPEGLTFEHQAFKTMRRKYEKADFSAMSVPMQSSGNGGAYRLHLRQNRLIKGDGDGTVPVSSTTPLLDARNSERSSIVEDVSHDQAGKMYNVQARIKEAIVTMCHEKMYRELTARARAEAS